VGRRGRLNVLESVPGGCTNWYINMTCAADGARWNYGILPVPITVRGTRVPAGARDGAREAAFKAQRCVTDCCDLWYCVVLAANSVERDTGCTDG
jgi:hypothetical protein